MPSGTTANTTRTTAPDFETLLDRTDLRWMGQNTTHLEPPGDVLAAIQESLSRREFQLYAPALGFEELRRLVVDDVGAAGADAWITNGAVDGLHHICTALATSISRLVTTDPGWPWPGRFAALEGIPVRVLPIWSADDGYKLTATALAAVLEPKSLIYLIDPLNPLGSCYTREELVSITDLARDSGSIVVHDCTYRHFAEGHTLAADLYPEGTFTTYSFSKWLGLAGFRLGAVLARPELLQSLTAVPSNPLGAGIVAQRAAIAGLKVSRPWMTELRRINQHNQRLVTDAVARSGLGSVVVSPSAGNFMAVDLDGSGWGAEALCATMLEQGFFIRPGTYQSPTFGHRFVKISTSVPTSWVEEFAAAWEALPHPPGRPS